jgi:hypothetical protein
MKWILPALFMTAALAACSKPADNSWQGYIEGEYVMLASPAAGQLQKLYVRRGDKVDLNKPLFALEQESERAARLQAEDQLKSAAARLENLRAGRRRRFRASRERSVGPIEVRGEIASPTRHPGRWRASRKSFGGRGGFGSWASWRHSGQRIPANHGTRYLCGR